MEELIQYITQFGQLSQSEVDIIHGNATEIELQRDNYFSRASDVPQQVGFLKSGIIRSCYYSDQGEEITRFFIQEKSLVVDYVNFEANTVSSEYLQACTDCKLIVFPKEKWEELSQSIVGWDTIKNKMVQSCMYHKFRKVPVISQSATTRYLEFMEKYPSLINRIPLAYIASYIGVTQQSLSRIRKNIR